MRHRAASIFFLAVAPALACATVPAEAVTDSQAAVRAAEEVGAANQPQAQYHLELAREQIAAAKTKLDGSRRDKRDAEALLDRAKADAELAIAYAQTHAAQGSAEEARSEIQDLQR